MKSCKNIPRPCRKPTPPALIKKKGLPNCADFWHLTCAFDLCNQFFLKQGLTIPFWSDITSPSISHDKTFPPRDGYKMKKILNFRKKLGSLSAFAVAML